MAADAFMTPGDMFTAFTQLTRPLPFLMPASPAIVGGTLANGVHNLKLEVEDRAGNISEDFLLEITVDSAPPPVSFGLPDAASIFDGLHADSDTGSIAVPTTLIWGRHDRATPLSIAEDTSRRFGWDLRIIEDAADDPALEQPEAFMAALQAAVTSKSGIRSATSRRDA